MSLSEHEIQILRNKARIESEDFFLRDDHFKAIQHFKSVYHKTGISIEEKIINLDFLVFHKITACHKDNFVDLENVLNHLKQGDFQEIIKEHLCYAQAQLAYFKGDFKKTRQLLRKHLNSPSASKLQLGHHHLLLGKANWKIGHTLFAMLHYFKAYSYFDDNSIWRLKIMELIARQKMEMMTILDSKSITPEDWLNKALKQFEAIFDDPEIHSFYFSIRNHKVFYFLEKIRLGTIHESELPEDLLVEIQNELVELEKIKNNIYRSPDRCDKHLAALEKNKALFHFLEGREGIQNQTPLHEKTLKDYHSALEQCFVDKKIRLQIFLNDAHPTIGRNLINQSSTHHALYLEYQHAGNTENALASAKQALKIAELALKKSIGPLIYNNKGQLDYTKLEIKSNYNLIQAIRCKINALVIAPKLDVKELLNTLDFGENIVELVRADFKSESANITFSSVAKRLYESALDALYKIQRVHPELSKDIRNTIFRFFENSSFYSIAQTFAEDASSFINSDTIIQKICQQIFDNEEVKLGQNIEDLLAQEFEQLPSQTNKIKKIPTTEELQTLVTHKARNKVALIAYFLGEEKLYAHIIKKNGEPQFLLLKEGKDELGGFKKDIRELLNLLDTFVYEAGSERTDRSLASIHELRNNLTNALIKPIRELEEVNFLLITPDSELAQLPFEILMSQKGHHFLIEDFNIAYHYSVALLYNRVTQPVHSETYKYLLTAIGSNIKVLDTTVEVDTKSFIHKEVYNISTIVEPFGKTQTYINEGEFFAASHEEIKACISDAQIVHISCHEQIKDNANIYLSQQLSLNAQKDFQNKQVDLVILNACKSSGQQIIVGEGIKGLGRAFLKNKQIKNVIYTLSNVPDDKAKILMEYFYEALFNAKEETDTDAQRSQSIAVALGEAKRKLIKTLLEECPLNHIVVLLALSHIFVGNPLDYIELPNKKE